MSAPDPAIDCFVIGAMKAATTNLCDWLDAQPDLALSQPKEPAIFASDQAVASWTGRTATLWPDATNHTLLIEGSTDYAKHPSVPGVPERVRAHHPEARFVYLMRHPVERLISQYRFEWLLNADNRTFEQALREKPQLIENSRYAAQLTRWLEAFPRDRFLLMFAEAFAEDPPAQVHRVLDFLGRPETEVKVLPPGRSNDTSLLVRPSLARRILRDSRAGRVARPLVPPQFASMYHRRLQRRSMPDVGSAERGGLVEAFDRDLKDLSMLTGGPAITCETWNDVSTTWTPQLLRS